MFNFSALVWRLIPANPILLRVVESGGKRIRDLVIRCLYLGVLVLVVLFLLGNTSTGNLSELSIQSARIFSNLSYLQLLLVALLAPIFTAGAITQEQDSQTYDILLATPLSNGQIVLGSLVSRLFFVFALLVSGVPIFSITQVFGGVAIGDIVLSVAIAATTALVTGALAIAIATFKVGTRRTIFSFYLFNVIYLVGLYLLDEAESLHVPLDAGVSVAGDARVIGWLTPFHPFLALRSVLDPVHYVTPTLSQLPPGLRTFPARWMLTHPVGFYLAFTSLLSCVLVLPSIVLLRRMAQSTQTIQSRLLKLMPFHFAEKKRKARAVWANPIAWREAKTKASAARSTVLRIGFILLGMAGAIAVLVGYGAEAGTTRQFVEPGSYNAASNTLFVRGVGEQTYALDPNLTTVRIATGTHTREGGDWRAATLDDLNHRYAILPGGLNVGTVGRGASAQRIVRSIDLAPIERRISPRDARRALLGLVLVEVTAILLIITNAAASTVTREKEDGTLDLLLSTPITSRFYIWGKIRGLVAFVLPLLTVPVASCALFVMFDLWRMLRGDQGFDWTVLPESVLLLPAMLVVVMAFASVIGMQMSLRCRTTVWAVMSSVGIMIGVCGALGWCGSALLSSGRFQEAYVAISSFSPITVIMLLIAPTEIISDPSVGSALEGTARALLLVFGLAATGAYAALVWSLYGSMVKNFDMTIRKQSR